MHFKCGENIYDTYIRYRHQATVDITDLFLREIIEKTILSIIAAKKIQKIYKFKYFYAQYSTYIQHGIFVKVLLSMGVKVFTSNTLAQYNKKLSKKNFLHVENYKMFKNIFKKLNKKQERLNLAQSMLKKIFYGKRKNLKIMDYMSVDPFSKNYKKLNDKIDGVIFLPNFFESQREWGKLIFLDFHDWINFTCETIVKYNLNIAIKPHPNMLKVDTDSIEFVENLKKKFSKIKWIDPMTSNLDLFKKIKFGVSPWGTVLWELPYFSVNSISAGEHPACMYRFGYEPRNKKDYQNYLIKGSLLKQKNISKKMIHEFCYMYYIHNNDAFKTLAREIDLNQLDSMSSYSLLKFIKKIENKFLL
jgi:hypothetical protein